MVIPATLSFGIDPGKNGGWALLREDGFIIDTGHQDEFNRLHNYKHRIVVVCLERVSNWRSDMPGQHMKMSPMIESFGWWQGFCAGLELPEPKLIHPRTWRANFGLAGTITIGKRKVQPDPVVFVNQVFDMKPPLLKKEDGQAVAILLADYGRRFL